LHKVTPVEKLARDIIVLMDTTYWGSKFGVMLFKDSITGENLLKYYVKPESNKLYRKGISELKFQGYPTMAIVCDGRRGLLQSFDYIPVQMCQFHQAAIIRRYLTKKPKMPAAIELKNIVKLMTETDRESFEGLLKEWYNRWKLFLNERSINEETGKHLYS
jgi:hypothetical protein